MIIFKTKNIRNQSISMARATCILGHTFLMSNEQASTITSICLFILTLSTPVLVLGIAQ